MMRSVILKSLKTPFLKQNTGYFSTSAISEIEKDIKLLTELKNIMVAKGEDTITDKDGDALLCWIKDLATDDKEGAYPEGRKLIVQYSRKQFKWTPEADSKFKREVLNWARERKNAAKAEMKVPTLGSVMIGLLNIPSQGSLPIEVGADIPLIATSLGEQLF